MDMVDEHVSLKELSWAQRQQRLAQKRADAEEGMREHQDKQGAAYENLERLRALRLARETKDKGNLGSDLLSSPLIAISRHYMVNERISGVAPCDVGLATVDAKGDREHRARDKASYEQETLSGTVEFEHGRPLAPWRQSVQRRRTCLPRDAVTYRPLRPLCLWKGTAAWQAR
jgi:hypothetical protein